MIRLILLFTVVLLVAFAEPGWSQTMNSIQLRNASGSTILQAAATGGPFTLTFPSTAPGNGQTLISDNAGVLSWGSAGGATSIDGLSDAVSNSNVVALGSDAGKDIVGGGGGYSVLIGNNAGKALVSSSNNVAVGYDALLAATGGNNVSIGTESLNGLTGGTNNVAIGNYAGSTNLVTGAGNVFIGDNVYPSADVSNKLYIDNSYSASDQPLIYGDFSTNEIVINGSLQAGQVRRSYYEVSTGNHTVSDTDCWMSFAQDTDVLLPDAATNKYRELTFITRGAGTLVRSVNAASAAVANVQDRDGNIISNIVPFTYRWVTLVSDGTNWVVVQYSVN